jgi:iron complex transport system ATP-binding protein
MSVEGLRIEGLGFGYEPGASVLAGVDVDVGPGELVVLVGANGSGKSTLLRLAAGLRRPDQGSVRLDGRSVVDLDPRERARAIAFLPQDVHPVHRLTAREVVELGRHPHRSVAWSSAGPADRAAVDEAIAVCDVTSLQSRAFDTLSGGERQRVSIAAAIAQSGRVLVLDEPTAALDLPHQVSVFELLSARARAGLAVLLATHDLNLAASFGDRVVVLHEGRVLASGSADEVVRTEVLGPVLGPSSWIGPHPATGGPCVLPRAEGRRR